MDTKQYDAHLKTCQTYKDWKGVPQKDYRLHFSFGTLNPKILHRPHRLITSNNKACRTLIHVLGDDAATIGIWMPTLGYNLDGTVFEEVWGWKIPENQEELLSHIEDMKFEEQRHIIFSASLSQTLCEEIDSSLIIQGRHGDTSEEEWFNAVYEKLPDLGWAYIPLSEITSLDFFVVSERYAPYLEKIDKVFEENGWECKPFVKGEERWFWPD